MKPQVGITASGCAYRGVFRGGFRGVTENEDGDPCRGHLEAACARSFPGRAATEGRFVKFPFSKQQQQEN